MVAVKIGVADEPASPRQRRCWRNTCSLDAMFGAASPRRRSPQWSRRHSSSPLGRRPITRTGPFASSCLMGPAASPTSRPGWSPPSSASAWARTSSSTTGPGAGGIVAAKAALSFPADGYTLYLSGNGAAISESLFASLPFDITRDFSSVSLLAQFDMLLATKMDTRFDTRPEARRLRQAESGQA